MALSPYASVWIILLFFILHWFASAFAQTFFLHRYSSHRQFEMNRFWEGFWYLFTYLSQGSSYLQPRAYAVLHRMHHAYSDTEKDPHSPHFFDDVFSMMWRTKLVFDDMLYRRNTYELGRRFDKGIPEWLEVDRIANSVASRLLFCVLYTTIYLFFAPSPWFFLLLPVHFLMGPVHGAVVNWCGHKYGYRNFNIKDESRNTSPLDILFLGELFQNNHHKYPGSARFAQRWWEADLTFPVIRVFHFLRILRMKPNASGF